MERWNELWNEITEFVNEDHVAVCRRGQSGWCNFCGWWACDRNPLLWLNVDFSMHFFDAANGGDCSYYYDDEDRPLCLYCARRFWRVCERMERPTRSLAEHRMWTSPIWIFNMWHNRGQWWCGVCSRMLYSDELHIAQARYWKNLPPRFDQAFANFITHTRVCGTCIETKFHLVDIVQEGAHA